jgi:hypothetical protein
VNGLRDAGLCPLELGGCAREAALLDDRDEYLESGEVQSVLSLSFRLFHKQNLSIDK